MYKLDSSVDFTITTQATLNSIEANEQAAFGLMVRDEIGEHGSGDLDTTKNNFAFVGGYGKKKPRDMLDIRQQR